MSKMDKTSVKEVETMSHCGIHTKGAAESAVLFYGILACTISLVWMLYFSGYLIYIALFKSTQFPDVVTYFPAHLLMVGLFYGSTVVFALFLIKGIKYRKPKYLLSYFIFAIVKSILLMLAFIAYICLDRGMYDHYDIIEPAISMGVFGQTQMFFDIFALYTMPLPLVWIAYRSVGGHHLELFDETYS